MATYGASARIYPPTAVEDWLYCPMYRHLRRSWLPEVVERDGAIQLGTAVGTGISEHWRRVRAGMAVDTPEYWAAILRAAEAILEGDWHDGDLTLEGAKKLAAKGLREALGANLESGAQVLRVDESIGVSKPDLILRRPNVGLEVWDVKTARSLDARYIQDRLSGYDTLWQLYHGAWETEEFYGERVVRCGILQVILSPRAQAIQHSFPMEPAHLEQWHQTAQQVWADMDAEEFGNRAVVQRYTSCEKRRFGRARCEFHAACHLLYLDPEKMKFVYERRVP